MWALLLISLLIAAGRFTVPGHGLSWPGAYEAIAHVWVGYLIGMIVLDEDRCLAATLLGVLTAIEVVMFMMRG